MPSIIRSGATKWRDHIFTYLAEALVMLGTILVYKLAADRFGDDGFNIYAVARRTNSFLLPLAMLGLSVAVVRSVAMARSEAERLDLLRSAFVLLGIVSIVLVAIFILLPGQLAFLVFGDAALEGLMLPLVGLVIGQILHSLLYAYWRGSMQMDRANMLQVIDLAIVPLVAFFVSGSMRMVLLNTAIAWVVISIVPLVVILFTRKAGIISDRKRALLKYGAPRVPGDLALAALLTIPVYIINHTHGLASGGQVAFGLTLLNLTGALFAPISLLMLPSVAGALSRKDHAAVKREVIRTRNGALLISVLLVAIFQIFARPMLDLYLGGIPPGLATITRIIFSAAIFYAVFISLRSVLDAYYETARNSRNILITLAFFSIGAACYLYFRLDLEFLLAMIPGSMLLLAWLTWRDVHAIISNSDRQE